MLLQPVSCSIASRQRKDLLKRPLRYVGHHSVSGLVLACCHWCLYREAVERATLKGGVSYLGRPLESNSELNLGYCREQPDEGTVAGFYGPRRERRRRREATRAFARTVTDRDRRAHDHAGSCPPIGNLAAP
jgi:hypothetical protein